MPFISHDDMRSDNGLALSRPGADPARNPIAAAMLAGVQLRALRGDLTLAAAARRVGWSAAKLSRLENGWQAPKPGDAAKFLNAFQAAPEVQSAVEELVMHAQAAKSHWLHAYRDLVAADVQRLIALESAAAFLITYEAKIVPGLAQTPSYYRALFAAHRKPCLNDELERRAALRRRRQELFFANPAGAAFFLEEDSLYREIGSPQVMAEQINHLISLTYRENFDIRIITRKHLVASSVSSMTKLDFGSSPLRELIYNETLTGADYYTDAPDVASFPGEPRRLAEMERYEEELRHLMRLGVEQTGARVLLLKALRHFEALI
ncbi:Scr1 family TA system antitoxin-like transcriptional regulator [Kitasatospora sp. NPDC059827]|uniref:Scr1 family TA system antitoxin-like transcriptional regulator n=1 Tax=Kitasatospora sp. NPDC059827 TaxID=3346964 RepID=UPI00366206EE